MILNSFSEVNASLCPGAFQELNGLTIILPNEEQLVTPVSNARNFPNVSLPLEPDFSQSDDILLKALQSPFPTLHRGAPEPVNHNDVLRYLNLAPGDSDAETVSKFSAESSSSHEPAAPSIDPEPLHQHYGERRMLSISDVCDRTNDNNIKHSTPIVGCKRKAGNSNSSSKRCKVTQPSKFCHICVRSGEQVSLVPCANVIGSVCRKAICEKCFSKHGIGHEWNKGCENREIIRQIHAGLLDRLPDNVWTCLHCRQMCPQSAQCKIYARTNRRRHMILKQRKAEKDRTLKRNMERSLRISNLRSSSGSNDSFNISGTNAAGTRGFGPVASATLGASPLSRMLNSNNDYLEPLNRISLPPPTELSQLHQHQNLPRH